MKLHKKTRKGGAAMTVKAAVAVACVAACATGGAAARVPAAQLDSATATLDTRVGSVAAPAEVPLDTRTGSQADSNPHGLNTTKLGLYFLFR